MQCAVNGANRHALRSIATEVLHPTLVATSRKASNLEKALGSSLLAKQNVQSCTFSSDVCHGVARCIVDRDIVRVGTLATIPAVQRMRAIRTRGLLGWIVDVIGTAALRSWIGRRIVRVVKGNDERFVGR
jgi:hypothetical protein